MRSVSRKTLTRLRSAFLRAVVSGGAAVDAILNPIAERRGSEHATVLIIERGLVMMRTIGFLLMTSLWAAVSFPLAAEEMRLRSSQLGVVAIASDVKAIVFRDAGGFLLSYTVGDVIAESDWYVAEVSSSAATLESTKRFHGAKLSTRIAIGDVFDFKDAGLAQEASSPATFPDMAYAHPIKPSK